MMKTLLLPVLLSGSSLFAGTIRKDTLVNLKLNQPSQLLDLHYPGQISGICGLAVTTSSDLWLSDKQLAALAKEVIVSDGFQDDYRTQLPAELSEYSLSWNLVNLMTYVTKVEIKTRNGQSLKSVVSSITGSKDAAVLIKTVECSSDNQD